MKSLIYKGLFAALTLTAVQFAQADANPNLPQCYGQEEVSKREPFILSISGVSQYEVEEIAEELILSNLIVITHTMNFTDTSFAFVISIPNVEGYDRALMNEKVNVLVHEVMVNHGLKPGQYALECNSIVRPAPRAGGMNGNTGN